MQLNDSDLFVTVLVTQFGLGVFIWGPTGESQALALVSGSPGKVDTDLYLVLTS